VLAAAFTLDGRGALSASADGSLRLWQLKSGAEIRRLSYADQPQAGATA
jgi:hypothetical protein